MSAFKLNIPKSVWNKSQVTFLRPADVVNHLDERRLMSGVVADFSFPFPIRQIKFIELSAKSAKAGLAIGNHHHLKDSGQWEIVVVLGEKKNKFFLFRYRNQAGRIGEKKLRGGDVVIIPPGCSLALKPLVSGARMLEISNQYYHSNYAKDILFP